MIPIDQLIRSKRRSISLIIERDGSLVVRAPLRAPETLIHEFVSEHEKWIRKKQEQFRATYVPVKPKEYIDGEEFRYLGELYKLRLVEKSRPVLALKAEFELSRKSLPRAAAVFERWYRAQALQVLC